MAPKSGPPLLNICQDVLENNVGKGKQVDSFVFLNGIHVMYRFLLFFFLFVLLKYGFSFSRFLL